MAKPNPARRARTKERIADAFWRLYKEGGLRAATVSAIIAEAGVHRSTFYEYFADAPAALAAIEDEQIAYAAKQIEGALADADKVDVVDTVVSIYGDNADKLSVLLGKSTGDSFARRLKQSIVPLVEGSFGVDASSGANRYAFEFVLSGILSAMTLWYERGCAEPLEDVAETLRTLMLDGPLSFMSHTR